MVAPVRTPASAWVEAGQRALGTGGCADADEVEARSTLAFSLLIGSHFLAAGHPGRSRAEALELAAAWLLD